MQMRGTRVQILSHDNMFSILLRLMLIKQGIEDIEIINDLPESGFNEVLFFRASIFHNTMIEEVLNSYPKALIIFIKLDI